MLAQLLGKAKTAGPRVHDGRIAALCVHHGVRELLSADRDFHVRELEDQKPARDAVASDREYPDQTPVADGYLPTCQA